MNVPQQIKLTFLVVLSLNKIRMRMEVLVPLGLLLTVRIAVRAGIGQLPVTSDLHLIRASQRQVQGSRMSQEEE